MLARWTPYLRILFGILLLTTPALWQPGADYATVTYHATEVEYTDDYLRLGEGALTGQIQGLACYGLDESRYCALETYVGQNGPITVRHTEYALPRAEFVAAGGLYRPVANRSAENVTLGLESVTPETVLGELARPAAELSDPAREALRTGERVTVRASVERLNRRERRPARFVARNDSYYLLRSTDTAHDGAESPLETPVKVGAFALGLWLVLRGQSMRDDLADPPL